MDVLISGVCGHMGKHVYDLVQQDSDLQYAGGVDVADGTSALENVFEKFADVNVDVDIIIDFSFHGLIGDLLNFAIEKNIPAVIATTGHTDDEKQMIQDAAKKIPVFFASNYSIGIATLAEISKKAASTLPDADIEIVEVHHTRKLDAPSGTALTLAENLKSVRQDANIVCGRNGLAKREPNDIGVNSVRLGNIVGIHEIQIGTANETLTLKHEVHDRAVFADGSIVAAKFLINQNPGLYSMSDIFSL